MTKKFFITTPIYYTNAIPHIGNAYASILCDVIARYKKINWYNVKFSTWVDENSQKAVLKAEELWKEIMPYLDEMAAEHRKIWDWLEIEYTDFIRTTEPRHHKFVQEVLQKTFDKWDIYEWVYEWLYCVGCEAFKKEEDLNTDWLCPDHLKKPEHIKEKNYFFRLSKYENRLLDFYEKNPNFVVPVNRFAEIKEFIKRWLEDFSISRETNKFGIPLPFDASQVTYVWYDALLNYLTVCQNWDEDFWPANLHVVGKDILKFHAIYWPAMLMAADYAVPEQILATWFFTINGQKISKSLWNAINPVEFSEKYSKDLMYLYLLWATPVWQDWDFSESEAVNMFNSKLANNLWNLSHRFTVLTIKNWFEKLYWEIDSEMNKEFENYEKEFENFMNIYDIKNAIDCTFAFLDKINKYLDITKPRELKEENRDKLKTILFTMWESLKIVSCNMYPFFKDKMTLMLAKIGLWNYAQRLENWERQQILEEKTVYEIKDKWEIIYQRLEK